MSAPDDSSARKLISVLIPVFNERENVRRAATEVTDEFRRLESRYDFEIIFTDNHSDDGTDLVLRDMAMQDPRIKVMRFIRNFGFQKSLLTAYRAAAGVAAIQIDCDLQDPPAMIPRFLEKWEAGHDVVVGIRIKRIEPLLLQAGRRLYYKLLRKIAAEYNIVENAGDFRLVNRRILDLLKQVNDAQPFTRGMISSLSANQTGIPYERNVRKFGKSKFPLRRLFGFAAGGVISHSMVPLRLATVAGLGAFLLSILVGLYYAFAWVLAGKQWPAGFATTALLLLFSIGLNGIFIGIVGEYVGRIYEQVRYRPTTIVEWSMNLIPHEDPGQPIERKGSSS